MSSAYGIKAIKPTDAEHVLGFASARSTTDDALFEIWNGSSVSALVLTVDKDGQVQAASGAVGRPAYSFEADKDTGIYYVASGTTVRTAIGGADVVSVAPAGVTITGTLNVSGELTLGGSLGLHLGDNELLTFGAAVGTPDFWLGYSSSGSRFEFVTTNANGSGTDGVVFYVGDTVDDVVFTGNTTAVNVTASGSLVGTLSTAAQGSVTSVGTLTALTVSGDASVGDDLTLGSDAAVLNFGADSDVSLTHVHNTGLLLNSSRQLQFNDSSQYIAGTSGTVLSIVADAEIDLTATAIDINGTVNISGAAVLATSLSIASDTAGGAITGIKDEDNMASNSATKLATQQSIVAYIATQISAEDLDVSSDSGTIDIDLNSETLTIAGGTGIDTSASSTTVTITGEAASLTNAGIVEIATAAETNTGTDATRAVSPDGLEDWTGSAQVTTLGTIVSGTWTGTTLAANKGGTGQTSYAVGDILYATGSAAVGKLTALGAGKILRAAGTGAAPAWTTATFADTYASGDLVYAGSTNVVSGLTKGSSNQVLTSSGSVPQWVTQIDNAALPTNVAVAGTLSANGNVTLGNDAAADTLTLNAKIVTDLLPSGTRDLGTTDDEWEDLWIDGTANIDTLVVGPVTVGVAGAGADVTFYSGTSGDQFVWDASEEKLTITGTNGQTALDVADGNVTVAGTLAGAVATFSSTVGITGVTTHGDDVVSDTDSTDDLGTTGVRWANLWVDDVVATTTVKPGTLVLAAGSITDTSGAIDFGNENLVTTGTLGSGALTAGTIAGSTITGSGVLSIDDTTQSTSTTTGSVHTDGGLGVVKNTFLGGTLAVADDVTLASGIDLKLIGNGEIGWDSLGPAINVSSDDLQFNASGNYDVVKVSNGNFEVAGNVGIGQAAGAAALTLLEAGAGGQTALLVNHSHGSQPVGVTVDFTAGAPDDRTYYFFRGEDTSGNKSSLWSDGGATFTGKVDITDPAGAGTHTLLHLNTTSTADSGPAILLESNRGGVEQQARIRIAPSTGFGVELVFDTDDTSDPGTLQRALALSDAQEAFFYGPVGMGTTTPNTIAGETWTDIDLQIREPTADTGCAVAIVGAAQAHLILCDEDSTANSRVYSIGSISNEFRIDAWNDNEGVKGNRFKIDGAGQTTFTIAAVTNGPIIDTLSTGTPEMLHFARSGTLKHKIRLETSTEDLLFLAGSTEVLRLAGDAAEVKVSVALEVAGSTTMASTLVVQGQATVTVADISTGENVGLKLNNVGGGGLAWHITPGVTGVDNATFCIRDGTNNVNALKITASGGTATFVGAVSKASGSFKIDHPLPAKTDTHHLVHSFIEGPRADLIYRGVADLSGGSATVDLDEAAGITEGTWGLLCRDPQCWIQNDSGWSGVSGSIEGNTLTIECEEAGSSDTVSWMVVAERCDPHMYDTGWTDDDGRVIVEPEKEEEG